MIYFDNAATTFYKPPQVIDCVLKSLNNPANANRGSHSLSVAATAQITEVRNKVARMVNLSAPAPGKPWRLRWTSPRSESTRLNSSHPK